MNSYRKQLKNVWKSLVGKIRFIVDFFLIGHFIIRGKKPFIRGYDQYKWRIIKKIVAKNRFSSDKLPARYGHLIDERIIEYPWLFSRLPVATPGRLLDAGSVLNFDPILKHDVFQNKQLFIMTLAPEIDAYWDKGISYLFDDLRSTCFKQEYFDWIVSMSTLEHIGLDNTSHYTADPAKKELNVTDYQKAVTEFHRILKPGGTLYLTFPFGAKKVYKWLQIFDGEMVDDVVAAFDPAECKAGYYRYTPQGWSVATEDACSDAIYHDFAVDGYSRTKPAAAEAVVCLELTKKM